MAELGEYDENRVKFLTCQAVEDEYEAARTLLEELAAYAEAMGAPALPGSGRQEYLESIVNQILF